MKKLLIIFGIILLASPVAQAYTSRGPIVISGDCTSPFLPTCWNTYNGVSDGDGSEEDPFIITGWYIDARSSSYGISITETDMYFEIKDCFVSGADRDGIYLYDLTGSKLDNVISNSNTYYGLDMTYVAGMEVTDSTFNANGYGGIKADSVQSSDFDGIDLVSNDSWGIYMASCGYSSGTGNNLYDVYAYDNGSINIYLWYSDYNDLVECGSYESDGVGVYFSNSDYNSLSSSTVDGNGSDGVRFYLSDYNEVFYSTIIDNGYSYSNNGIALNASDDNTIWLCTLETNDAYGVSLNASSQDNTVFHNDFIGNNDGGTQGFDDAYNANVWYAMYASACVMGNYWDNMTCTTQYVLCGPWPQTKTFCTEDEDMDGNGNATDVWPSATAYNNP